MTEQSNFNNGAEQNYNDGALQFNDGAAPSENPLGRSLVRLGYSSRTSFNFLTLNYLFNYSL